MHLLQEKNVVQAVGPAWSQGRYGDPGAYSPPGPRRPSQEAFEPDMLMLPLQCFEEGHAPSPVHTGRQVGIEVLGETMQEIQAEAMGHLYAEARARPSIPENYPSVLESWMKSRFRNIHYAILYINEKENPI
jgi:hypothetical protein